MPELDSSAGPSQDGEYDALLPLLGDHVTTDPVERSYYRRDLAAVPGILAALIGRTLPGAVARPRNTNDVVALVQHAAGHRLAVTPRAAATTVYWNAVPVRSGLVLDMNGLRGLVHLDEERLVASVLPSTRWQELDALLHRRGYSVLSYPTSAPAATVAGWVSMEGYGIGSLEHGGLAEQVVALEVVLPDGRVITAGAPGELPASAFCRAEGTLGIITRVDLKIRRAPESRRSAALSFPDPEALYRAIPDLAAMQPTPYCVHFADANYQRTLRRAGFEPPSDHATVLVTFEGHSRGVAAGITRTTELAAQHGADVLDDQIAEREWHERFMALRLKRSGPTVLGAESWIGLDQLSAYASGAEDLAKRQKLSLATYGTVVKGDEATVMSLFPCDESRMIQYILDLSLTRQLFGTAFRRGGRPYGIGVWSSPYRQRAFSQPELAEIIARKQKLDPAGIMNPGKLYSSPLLLTRPIFDIGMGLLAGVRRLSKVVS